MNKSSFDEKVCANAYVNAVRRSGQTYIIAAARDSAGVELERFHREMKFSSFTSSGGVDLQGVAYERSYWKDDGPRFSTLEELIEHVWKAASDDLCTFTTKWSQRGALIYAQRVFEPTGAAND